MLESCMNPEWKMMPPPALVAVLPLIVQVMKWTLLLPVA